MDIMEHKLKQVADRVRELRLISGLSVAEMYRTNKKICKVSNLRF